MPVGRFVAKRFIYLVVLISVHGNGFSIIF